MDITLQKPASDTSRNILLKAGYKDHHDPNTGKTSFSLRLGNGRYPRFHCYVKEDDSRLTFSLHIDQKEASYGGSHMHSGEYDGKLVEDEMGRINLSLKAIDPNYAQGKTKPGAVGRDGWQPKERNKGYERRNTGNSHNRPGNPRSRS